MHVVVFPCLTLKIKKIDCVFVIGNHWSFIKYCWPWCTN